MLRALTVQGRLAVVLALVMLAAVMLALFAGESECEPPPVTDRACRVDAFPTPRTAGRL